MFDAQLDAALRDAGIELICLAGFMRILTDGFVRGWEGRILNIHPSLLPAFKGVHVHEQALEAGVKFSGCTVHFVVPELDSGPIIEQAGAGAAERHGRHAGRAHPRGRTPHLSAGAEAGGGGKRDAAERRARSRPSRPYPQVRPRSPTVSPHRHRSAPLSCGVAGFDL